MGPPAAPHVPLVAPGAITHGAPAQQSAVVVHAAALGWHFTPTQTNGGAPDGFATQGKLQQSALDAQALPASVVGSAVQSTPAARQRGMPRLSCLQMAGFCWTVPAQQRSVALHDSVASRQIEPAGLHLFPWSQRPTAAPAAFAQWVLASAPSGRVAEPQQSPSAWQTSPVGWHPLGGWQMSTPVAANGRQERLQQSPPQEGRAPPV
jgi:hypothetical protein